MNLRRLHPGGSPQSGMPDLLTGRRRKLLAILVTNALGQSCLAVTLAIATRNTVTAVKNDSIDAWTLLLLTLAGVCTYALRIHEAGTAESLGQHYVASVRSRMLRRLLKADDRHDPLRRHHGVNMTRLTGDLNSLRNWIAAGIARGGVAAFTLVALAAVCFWFHPAAGIVLFGWTVILMATSLLLVSPLRKNVRAARRVRGRLADEVSGCILELAGDDSADRHASALSSIAKHSRRLRRALTSRMRWAQSIRMLPAATLPLAFGAVIVLTGDRITPGDLVAILLLFSLAATQLHELTRAIDYRISFEEGRKRLSAVLRRRPRAVRKDADPVPIRPANIEPITRTLTR